LPVAVVAGMVTPVAVAVLAVIARLRHLWFQHHFQLLLVQVELLEPMALILFYTQSHRLVVEQVVQK
jgi:hypothetical protein